ncbi:carboxypeptidase-like regulatory domain-containing protein [Bremerella alba]|uniref:Carboxypeptidase regulatory-like domain-containing protein n=1 Tax=Bremerella alba TaxID=980252 RepID=A0A7V8V7C7_9BACT|nr:carboxypeptidase-like regulatory domain-containing protein [Bremerella alba]MBA2116233.1 hypothetical protein [Bremerella alba]
MIKNFLFVASLLFLVGCGPAGPHMINVTGSVVLDGKPVQGGSISFENTATGHAARGDIGDGSYQLAVPPGDYKVAIEPSLVEIPSKNPNSPPTTRYSENIPRKYHSVRTTDLNASVSDDQATFDFQLAK